MQDIDRIVGDHEDRSYINGRLRNCHPAPRTVATPYTPRSRGWAAPNRLFRIPQTHEDIIKTLIIVDTLFIAIANRVRYT